jgi:hypothetical protein
MMPNAGRPTRPSTGVLRDTADEASMTGDSGSMTARERAALRARAEQARHRARALTAQTLVLSAKTQRQFHDAEVRIAVAKELHERLQDVVARCARLARVLDEPPEQAVLVVKEAATEAIAIAKTKAGVVDPLEAQLLREQLVRWTVDAYFNPGPLSS